MYKAICAAAFVFSIAVCAPASARTYDCSKPGNATKTACKIATAEASKAIAKSAPKRMPAPKAAATKVSSTTTTKTTTERTYDCSKAGNKTKSVCKSAAVTPSKPVVKQTTTAVATRNYDCSKAGNATKQACKTSVVAHEATVAKPVAATRTLPSRPAVAAAPTSAPASIVASGATATCKDGTLSHAKVHSGACSHHGGVAKWF